MTEDVFVNGLDKLRGISCSTGLCAVCRRCAINAAVCLCFSLCFDFGSNAYCCIKSCGKSGMRAPIRQCWQVMHASRVQVYNSYMCSKNTDTPMFLRPCGLRQTDGQAVCRSQHPQLRFACLHHGGKLHMPH